MSWNRVRSRTHRQSAVSRRIARSDPSTETIGSPPGDILTGQMRQPGSTPLSSSGSAWCIGRSIWTSSTVCRSGTSAKRRSSTAGTHECSASRDCCTVVSTNNPKAASRRNENQSQQATRPLSCTKGALDNLCGWIWSIPASSASAAREALLPFRVPGPVVNRPRRVSAQRSAHLHFALRTEFGRKHVVWRLPFFDPRFN